MSQIKPIDRTNGELKTYLTYRIYDYLAQHCATPGYVPVRYATLAHLVGLPWIWRDNDNSRTIVVLRSALANLERARFIAVRSNTHDDVLVKLQDRAVTQ